MSDWPFNSLEEVILSNAVTQEGEVIMDKEDIKYIGLTYDKGEYSPISSTPKIVEALPPGIYTPYMKEVMHSMIPTFEKMEVKHDQILNIPSKEYKDITSEINNFLKPETKALYKEYGFIYKRSSFLFGEPGTGKSVIIERIAHDVVASGGIVLFDPRPEELNSFYDILNVINPNTTVLVIFEEMDKWFKPGYDGHFESILLSILDGEIQKENVIYLATTNYIDKIPKRILRPGRFSSKIEVKFPNEECRRFYLENKFKTDGMDMIVKSTAGFSIDEIKEVVLAHKCLGQTIGSVVDRIKEAKES